jgi:hypothetical protein
MMVMRDVRSSAINLSVYRQKWSPEINADEEIVWELTSTNGCDLFTPTTVTRADHKLLSDTWV